MVDKYKNIKKFLYTSALGGVFALNLATAPLAQQGTIEEKLNSEISQNSKISDEIKDPYKELSDEINLSFHEHLPKEVKIGRWNAYEKNIDGKNLYFVDGLDYAFLKLEIKSKEKPDIISCANYGIDNNIEGVASALKYDKKDFIFFMSSLTKKDEDTYIAYLKTNIKNKN